MRRLVSNCRLPEPIGAILPAEAKQKLYEQRDAFDMVA